MLVHKTQNDIECGFLFSNFSECNGIYRPLDFTGVECWQPINSELVFEVNNHQYDLDPT